MKNYFLLFLVSVLASVAKLIVEGIQGCLIWHIADQQHAVGMSSLSRLSRRGHKVFDTLNWKDASCEAPFRSSILIASSRHGLLKPGRRAESPRLSRLMLRVDSQREEHLRRMQHPQATLTFEPKKAQENDKLSLRRPVD